MSGSRAQIDDRARAFIGSQHVFFVATAPLSADGLINLSPKGLDTFRVLSPTRVAYLDFTGSGVETIAHIRENGRLTIMFCAFDGPPNILRLQGRGHAVERDDPAFDALVREGWGEGYAPSPGVRAIIVLDVRRVADSCGYGVPLYAYTGEREQMTAWCARKGPEGVRAYQRAKNQTSLDGLPGLDSARRA